MAANAALLTAAADSRGEPATEPCDGGSCPKTGEWMDNTRRYM
jgi:hypothetical protein